MGSFSCNGEDETPPKILIVGLDASGKTAILNHLLLRKMVPTLPTISFNCKTVTIDNKEVVCFDAGGGLRVRQSYRKVMDTSAVVYVVDSADVDRLGESLDEFFTYYFETAEKRKMPKIILATKQDLDGAMSVSEIRDIVNEKMAAKLEAGLGSKKMIPVYPVSAKTGEGIDSVFRELVLKL